MIIIMPLHEKVLNSQHSIVHLIRQDVGGSSELNCSAGCQIAAALLIKHPMKRGAWQFMSTLRFVLEHTYLLGHAFHA